MGLGEIGKPIFKLLSIKNNVVGYDINPKLMNKKKFEKLQNEKTNFLHVCFPFSKKFIKHVVDATKKFSPQCVVIHSTVSPYTTQKIQKKLSIPVIYSATRGIHKRMINDLKRYSKFFALEPGVPNERWAAKNYSKTLKKCGVKPIRMSNPLTLEIAKIVCDTSYYGWLINYAQLSNMIAIQHKIDFDEMWSFSDEIHQYLGNRPKMFPGIIGGHCVIPNLELIQNDTLNLIKQINTDYAKSLKTKSTAKKN